MALDHYVSQVHLRKFYSPKLGNRMYAIRKQDLKTFTPDAHSVCRIEAGNTNPFLKETRAIEEFLKTVEPCYNSAVDKIQKDAINHDCVYVISGFVAYILTCSPTAVRLHSGSLKNVIREAIRSLDSEDTVPQIPPELTARSLAELLDNGLIGIQVDPKYPQAIGMTGINSLINSFGNFKWEILVNSMDDSPFFTSDFPVAAEKTDNIQILNRIVPLTPNLAVRICPDSEYDGQQTDFSFTGFRYVVRHLTRQQVMQINRLLVKCAETSVFFRNDYEWVSGFVKKYAAFRLGLCSVKRGGQWWDTLEIERG